MMSLDGGALAALVLRQEPCRQASADGGLADSCSDHRSHDSSCTDASLPGRLSDTAEHPLNKTHHLLRHCLNLGQRQAALEHFGSGDPKEAAKEISRMGQRELQGKFKLVYGNTTHSNNNDWLRRKLFEAIGAAPLKANSKGKARKPHSSKPSKKAQSVEPASPRGAASGAPSSLPHHYHHHTTHHVVAAGGGSMHQPVMVPSEGMMAGGVRCSPKPVRVAASASLPVPLVAAKQGQPRGMAGAPRRMASYPPSPLVGASVLDMQRYHSALSRDTSDSEWEEGEQERQQQQQHDERNNQAGGSSSNSPLAPRPMLVLAPPPPPVAISGGMGLLVAKPSCQQSAAQLQQGAGASVAMPPAAPQPEGLGLDAIDLGLADTTTDWLNDSWGGACDVLGGFGLTDPPAPNQGASPLSSLDDDDVMLLPLDLSAIDTFAFA